MDIRFKKVATATLSRVFMKYLANYLMKLICQNFTCNTIDYMQLPDLPKPIVIQRKEFSDY